MARFYFLIRGNEPQAFGSPPLSLLFPETMDQKYQECTQGSFYPPLIKGAGGNFWYRPAAAPFPLKLKKIPRITPTLALPRQKGRNFFDFERLTLFPRPAPYGTGPSGRGQGEGREILDNT